MKNCKTVTQKNDGGHLPEVAVYESFQPWKFDWEILVFMLEGRLWEVVANPGGGGYFRNFCVEMCCWDPGTLNLYQS